MRKQLPIFLFLIPFLSWSQNDTTLFMGEFEVTAHRAATDFKQAARQVTVISRQEIAHAPVQSLSELLEFVAGVDVRQRGQFGVQSDISIRGGSFEQTLILLNGIKMSDPQTGHHNMNLPVDIGQIERIEILHGGASRVYGPNAFAGAINIITKTTDDNRISAQITGGEHGWYDAGVHTVLNTGKWNHSISYQRRGSDGFTSNTDFNWQNAFYQTSAQLKNHKVLLNAGWNQKAFGASTFYSANFPNQFEETQTRFISLADVIEVGRFTFSPRAYYRQHFDRFELFRESEGYYTRTPGGLFVSENDTAPGWYTVHNYHRTDSRGAEFDVKYHSKAGITTLGAEYRHEEIKSNVLGQLQDNPVSVPGEHPSASYTRKDFRQNISLYAEHNLTLKQLFISAGVLYNRNTAFDDEWFPGIDVAYQIGKHFRPYASWNRSVRFPTYTDLYYNLGGAVGSIDLLPESSINYELGTRWYTSHATGVVSVFRREGVNLIDWVRFSGSEITRAANITNVNITGIEATVQLNLRDWLGEKSPFSSARLGYSFLNADSASSGFESNYVLDFLNHQFSAVLIQEMGKRLIVQWNGTYQDRLGGYFSPEAGTELAFDPVFLLDVRVTHRTEMFEVFAEVANLFNQSFNDIGNVPQPGRWVRAGLKINVGF